MMTSNCGRLAGKLAVVTGAGSGIGKAICNQFASEGASLLMVDRNSTKLEAAADTLRIKHENTFECRSGDVSSAEFANSLFSGFSKELKQKADVLVNCAGITNDSLFKNMTEDQFDEVIQVNLKSVFIMTKAFITSLPEPGKIHPASIINISSIVGKCGNVGQANYAASKAGVIGFTKTIGMEMGRFGVRCNAVLPGFIKTPMTDAVPEKLLDKVIMQIPANRMGTPDEVAKACLFLASDESSYVNCATLEVAGGLSA